MPDVPHPYDTIAKLTALGYKGFDKSLDISLFEYHFIYSYNDPRSNGDLRVIYKVDGKDKYDWADFKADLDFCKEFGWIGIDGLLSFMGCSLQEFNETSLEHKINMAICLHGYENICGTAHHPFVIKEEGYFDFIGDDKELDYIESKNDWIDGHKGNN